MFARSMNLLHPRLWPLRTQARVLVCLLIAALAFGVGELWARRNVAQAHADAGQHLLQVARNMADRLSEDLALRASEVLQLSQLKGLHETTDPVATRTTLERFRDTLPASAWVALTDPQGTVQAATGDMLVGQSIAASPVFQNGRLGLWTGDVHTVPLLAPLMPQTPGERGQFVDVAAPVRNPDGSLRGVLALHLSWQWAEQLRATLNPRADDGLQLMVLGAKGELLLGLGSPGQTPLLPPDRLKPLEEHWALERWSDGVLAPTGIAPTHASGGFPGFGWRVVARDTSPAARIELTDARRALLPWAAGLGAACALVAWWLIGVGVAPGNRLAPASLREPQRGNPEGARVQRRSDVQQIAAAVVDFRNTLTDRDEVAQAVQFKAHVDALTGLWNRNYLNALAAKLAGAVADPQVEFCVLRIDLDGFKPVSDRYGPDAADQVLVQVAKRLRQVAREDDVVLRLEGDQFMLLLPCPPGEGAALSRQVAQRVVADLQRPMSYRTLSNLRIGCGVGAALWPQDGPALADVMAHADTALIAAQRAGRGQFRQHVAPVALPRSVA